MEWINYLKTLNAYELVIFIAGFCCGWLVAFKYFRFKDKKIFITQSTGSCAIPVKINGQVMDYTTNVVITYENNKPVRVGCPNFNKGKCELAKTDCEALNKQV
ncbi:hypothetical protein [Campylobacter pinnipediorum]|uniref:hypothetical protein n=1 Tax=Campylobacter pinnipediorum TaxID=1965231 RepID=UPI00112FC2CF|nr:hypothetical protein [Campylobacter pinnipediorum]